MTESIANTDAAVLDGVQVPAGTYNPNLEDPRHPGLGRQRKHATDLMIRLCQVYGIDYETRPEGEPWPPGFRDDLYLVLAMYEDLVADYLFYIVTRPKKTKGEPCPGEPNAA
ncbi:hypothetical protein [Streptosporangium sp. NPDC051022]|uniref:hypothetical protein n=1 Tax=Streptosporangium sp. NPDC051022 TaxID=3155752 RepID=UPI00344091D2